MSEADDKTVTPGSAEARGATNADDVITVRWSTALTFILLLVTALGFGGGIAFDRYLLSPANGQPVDSDAVNLSSSELFSTDDPVWGPADAKVTVVEFSDFQCPYCARFKQQVYGQIKATYGDRVRFVFRDFPLSDIHPDAEKAAEAAHCAQEQSKFWEYHDALFANQNALDVASLKQYAANLGLDQVSFAQCLDSGRMSNKVADSLAAGQANNVRGTPTFFINGKPLVGAQPIESFQRIIDPLLVSAR